MAENPPAFPCEETRNTSGDPLATPRRLHRPGMTLRDWFAGQIAASLCSANDGAGIWTGLVDDARGYSIVAERSYRMADAMLAQREKLR